MYKKGKILFVGFSTTRGGAARALSNMVKAIEGRYIVFIAAADEVRSLSGLAYLLVERLVLLLEYDGNPIKHSLNLWSSHHVIKALNESEVDVTNVHWVNNGTLSISSISKLPKNSVITLHDEWFYCGTEHIYNTNHKGVPEFVEGYTIFSKFRFGLPLSYLVWKLKCSMIRERQDIIFTTPSKWILERAKKSAMLRANEVHLIPNPIDTDVFYPKCRREVEQFRKKIGVRSEDFLVVFGGSGGHVNKLKGGDLFFKAMANLLEITNCKNVQVVLFGVDDASFSSKKCDFKCMSIGFVSSNNELAELYSAANCVVVPSRVESFGQVAAEACACSAPVVCFETTGLTDIVKDDCTGFTVPPFDTVLLAEKISNIMAMNKADLSVITTEARQHVIREFSFDAVASKYQELIESILRRSEGRLTE